MTRARSSLVSVADTPYYHCICRCVRRAFLCGEDAVTGRSFEHRRAWVRDRLALLGEVFALDLAAYALMSNHYHLVVRLAPERAAGWSDVEVIDRWTRVFSGPDVVQRYRKGALLSPAEQAAVTGLVALWRQRLGDLSWYMRCLNESIARQANAEDGCTGRFWEGRFKTQALLDEQALLTAMAYVDLNPVRAGMAATLESSNYTSVQTRLLEVARGRRPRSRTITGPTLLPFIANEHADAPFHLPFSLQDYLDLVDSTGRCLRGDKRGLLGDRTPRLLDVLGLDPGEWLPTVTQLQARFELVIGAPQRLRRLAETTGRRWFRGRAAALRLYRRASG